MTQGTKDLVAAAQDEGVDRFVLMSALGTSVPAEGTVPYYAAKWAEEQAVAGSGLEHVIFRPSFIFGRDGGVLPTFMKQVRYSPVVTVIGAGLQRSQPIWIDDVAQYFTRALDAPAAANRTFELGGPDTVDWNALYSTIASVLGKRRRLLHVPIPVARAGAQLTQWLPDAPLSVDQLTMLQGAGQCRLEHRCRRHLPTHARPTRRADPPLRLSAGFRSCCCSSPHISEWRRWSNGSSPQTESSRTATPCLSLIGVRETMRLTELAAELGMPLTTASDVVRRLESKSLVRRRPNPDDGRSFLFELTTRGDREWRRGWGALQRINAALADQVDEGGDARRIDNAWFCVRTSTELRLGGQCVQHVGIDDGVLAFHPQAGPLFDHRSGRQLHVGLGPDQYSADRGEAFEAGAGVDRVAHRGVGDVAVASDLAHHHAAAVDADAQPGPIRMSVGHARNPALQGQGGLGCSLRMVGLVTLAVEHGHDPVADELLHLTAVTRDQRRRDAPVPVEHGCDLGRG